MNTTSPEPVCLRPDPSNQHQSALRSLKSTEFSQGNPRGEGFLPAVPPRFCGAWNRVVLRWGARSTKRMVGVS